jgi:hypothetical protein
MGDISKRHHIKSGFTYVKEIRALCISGQKADGIKSKLIFIKRLTGVDL